MLKKHPEFKYSVEHVGEEKQAVLVIDNFLDSAELLIDYCCEHGKFDSSDGIYPGVRAQAPEFYMNALFQYVRPLIHEVFSLDDSMIRAVDTRYSMVVTPPSQLQPPQCFPHIDSSNKNDLASVYFLCSEEKGGTSLYRHKATGFEYVDSSRASQFSSSMNAETMNKTFSRVYMNGSNELFEQIASYSAKFNRFIMYRCTSLHSGNIAADFDFDPNPRTGRLTMNTFVGSVRQ